jgi:DNA-binding NarL/FixJ family response regulator
MDVRTVLVVEDDPMTRGLLAEILDASGFRTATASTGSDARRLCNLLDPDAVVMDIDLGVGPSGFDVADAMLAAAPHLSFLFLTNLPDARFAARDPKSLPRGSGYLRKEKLSRPGALVEALELVLKGHAAATPRDDLDPSRPLAMLSKNQIAVLKMVALGLSNQQIAVIRNTSVRAVQIMLTKAVAALGVYYENEGNVRVAAARSYIAAAGLPIAE